MRLTEKATMKNAKELRIKAMENMDQFQIAKKEQQYWITFYMHCVRPH